MNVVSEFSIHGITREVSAPVRLELVNPDLVRVDTEFELKLTDFGVMLKLPPLLSVDDHVKVKLNLLLGKG